MDNISFATVLYWYWFLISKRTLDFLNFIMIIFIFPILPYAIVAYKLLDAPDKHRRAFYGDGEILILCSAILCSFVAMLFENRTENEKKLNLFINLILIILFIIITLVFDDTQLTFCRTWNYIYSIIALTSVIMVFTVLFALYLHFRLKVNYVDVEKFIEEIRGKRIEKKAAKAKKSKGGTSV